MRIDSLLLTTGTAALVATVSTGAVATVPVDQVVSDQGVRIRFVEGPPIMTYQPRQAVRHQLGTLPIVLERDTGSVLAYHEESGFYGEGATDDEALDDMIRLRCLTCTRCWSAGAMTSMTTWPNSCGISRRFCHSKRRDARRGIGKLRPEAVMSKDEQFTVTCDCGTIVGSTKLSNPGHTRSDLDDSLQARICTQLHVRKAFWVDLVGCTKSRPEYLEEVGHGSCCQRNAGRSHRVLSRP